MNVALAAQSKYFHVGICRLIIDLVDGSLGTHSGMNFGALWSCRPRPSSATAHQNRQPRKTAHTHTNVFNRSR
eukprot:2807691-Amphidinium_carterae.1